MEQRADLYDLRLHRLEQLTSSMVESQASMVQVLQEHSERLERIEGRLDNIERRLDNIETEVKEMRELLTLVLDDLAFIKNSMNRGLVSSPFQSEKEDCRRAVLLICRSVLRDWLSPSGVFNHDGIDIIILQRAINLMQFVDLHVALQIKCQRLDIYGSLPTLSALYDLLFARAPLS